MFLTILLVRLVTVYIMTFYKFGNSRGGLGAS